MAKKKTSKPPELSKMFFRLPADWRAQMEKLKKPDETLVNWLLSIMRPILDGSVRLQRNESGAVIGFRPSNTRYRPALSPQQKGTGRKPDDEKAARMIAHFKYHKSISHTATEFGCSPSNVRRIFRRCGFSTG